jgi:hypothetical protein
MSTIPVDVWVDSQNFVRRMRETVRTPNQGDATPAFSAITETADFYDFGVPVQVSAPPAAEVASLSQVIPAGSPTAVPSIGAITAPPAVSGTLSPAQAAAAERVVRAFWTALAANDPSAAAQAVLPAQRSCVRSLLANGPKITVSSFRVVSAQPAGNGKATVLFTAKANATVGGTSLPVLVPVPGSQQWLAATEQAGQWYVDLAGTKDFVFSGGCG